MPKKELSFENAMERLEEIASQLESGEFTLDEALKLYEEGVKLIGVCETKLKTVEGSVKILVNKEGELTEEDFTPNEN
ncbi:MAG: exodeoxyribonuclease VII small subunit [Clostridia bacterium]|nr:exodeoxyribonuclease VII small subunit [Clostridia bacterium]